MQLAESPPDPRRLHSAPRLPQPTRADECAAESFCTKYLSYVNLLSRDRAPGHIQGRVRGRVMEREALIGPASV